MEKYFNFNTAKRYFHFVALRFGISYSIQSYWRDCGIRKNSGNDEYTFENNEFRIEQHSLISTFPYFTGVRDYSVNKNGQPPYQYDLIAIEIKGQNILAVGFPFKFLAKTTIESLIENKKYLSKATFLKPNLDKLVNQSVAVSFDNDFFKCHFSSLGMTLTGDTSLTSIGLGGNRPMESPIYKSLFKNVIQKELAHMESCALKCELSENEDEFIPKTRGNVHFDHFGNLKVYVHGSGKNVFVIPSVINLLKKLRCVETTLINPLLHSEDD